jgi:hypothetical protein
MNPPTDQGIVDVGPHTYKAVVDAFILFNEKEDDVAILVELLEAQGVKTYFWRRDIPLGTSWTDVEDQRLRDARAVLVILGKHGWGPTHLEIARQAQALGKRIIPVLLDDPPMGAMAEASELFVRLRYADLRKEIRVTPELLATIRAPELTLRADGASQFDGIVATLVDGNEEQRARTLHLIRTSRSLDQAALAARLASEIRERFSPDAARSLPTSSRDPTLIPSIRSWMLTALVWADERQEHRELLLAHLSPGHEPEAVVRFRVLAALYHASVPYLDEALLALGGDSAREVQALALAIQSPQRAVERFRVALPSSDFEDDVWPVLRVLRMVALPEMVPDVLSVLLKSKPGSLAEYDALYALTNPGMASAAAQLLRSPNDDAEIVARVISAGHESNDNAIRNFSGLLAAMDAGPVDQALVVARRDPATAAVAAAVARFVAELRRRPGVPALAVAGYNADVIRAVDLGDDPLGIQEDVQTLTAVIMARDVKPPLAVGLFGDWGAGKSWFMKSVQATAAALAEHSETTDDDTFCTHVVSIEFNAWHYSDTHLLPSLVDHILKKLSAYISPALTPEQEQAALVSELNRAREETSGAETELAEKQEQIELLQDQVRELRHARETTDIRLQDLQLDDLRMLLDQDEKLTESVHAALAAAGFRDAVVSVENLAAAAAEANSVREWVLSIADVRNRRTVLVLTAVVLLVIPLVAYGLRELTESAFVGMVAAAVAEFVAVVSGAAVALRNAAQRVRDRLAPIRQAKLKVEKALERKRLTPSAREAKLEGELAQREGERKAAAERAKAASDRVAEMEEEIRKLERSFATFLLDASQEYREHLGVISVIRRHFESLDDHLARASDRHGTGKRVDRIILYIDDLDRCRADKVLEVLEAVHLLLAYPLFVVIVGVDPRWLLNSLSDTYSAFQNGGRQAGDVGEGWAITPQNYLEKIFQIPFTLRPMTEVGYENLVDRLLTPDAQAEEGESAADRQPGAGNRDRAAPHDDSMYAPIQPRTIEAQLLGGEEQRQDAGDARPSHPSEEEQRATKGSTPGEGERPRFVLQKEALVIQGWETDFAKRLFALMPTPRAAKRFTNIYRMLKAPVGRERLLEFEGTAKHPGEFQLPMLLLALSIGAPAEAAALFPALRVRAAHGEGLAAALDLLAADTALGTRAAAVEQKIGALLRDPQFPDSAEALREWVPRVARFSFDLGRLGSTAPVTSASAADSSSAGPLQSEQPIS